MTDLTGLFPGYIISFALGYLISIGTIPARFKNDIRYVHTSATMYAVWTNLHTTAKPIKFLPGKDGEKDDEGRQER